MKHDSRKWDEQGHFKLPERIWLICPIEIPQRASVAIEMVLGLNVAVGRSANKVTLCILNGH
ncbi:hypothetical protein YTPLAS72_17690 [Nitrospira sp.]|nr:hypothetical protein YTPLAS72_17690 [Nitrospira sp.]